MTTEHAPQVFKVVFKCAEKQMRQIRDREYSWVRNGNVFWFKIDWFMRWTYVLDEHFFVRGQQELKLFIDKYHQLNYRPERWKKLFILNLKLNSK